MTLLFHFSEEPGITSFVPRAVRVPTDRPPGMEWLNGPLVWAIDEWHSPMYLFPRECPRILLWQTTTTTVEDVKQWFGDTTARMLAYIESAWTERLSTAQLYRYRLPVDTFLDLHDAGMWVSRREVHPEAVQRIDRLSEGLAAAGVELRVVPSLVRLRGLWDTTLHASGIRLRNAQGWGRPSRAGGP